MKLCGVGNIIPVAASGSRRAASRIDDSAKAMQGLAFASFNGAVPIVVTVNSSKLVPGIWLHGARGHEQSREKQVFRDFHNSFRCYFLTLSRRHRLPEIVLADCGQHLLSVVSRVSEWSLHR